MKPINQFLLAAVALAAVVIAFTGCVGGYAEVSSGPRYHHYHDHWYHDGPWMDGPRGYHEVRVAPTVRVRGTVRIP